MYPGVDRGVDLIEILDSRRVANARDLWNRGDALENGNAVASFMVRGHRQSAIRVRQDANIGFAFIGELNPTSISYLDIVARVRAIATVWLA